MEWHSKIESQPAQKKEINRARAQITMTTTTPVSRCAVRIRCVRVREPEPQLDATHGPGPAGALWADCQLHNFPAAFLRSPNVGNVVVPSLVRVLFAGGGWVGGGANPA